MSAGGTGIRNCAGFSELIAEGLGSIAQIHRERRHDLNHCVTVGARGWKISTHLE
jgi:hypothetical protein